VRAIHSDHAILGDEEPLRDAAVILAPDGTIEDVGPAGEILPRHAGLVVERIHGVIFPALINAHVHLELSALRGQIAGGSGFVPWVERLIGARSESTEEDQAAAIDRAVSDLVTYGTGAVGEVTNSLAAVAALARAKIGGSIFHEVFGLDRTAIMARVDGLKAELEERIRTWPTSDLLYAPAPHTLYTTHPDAVRSLAEHARARGLSTSLHLAEHAAERTALENGKGTVPAWLSDRLKIKPDLLTWPMLSPVAQADALGALGPHVIAVHLADARPAELALVAKRGSPVVLCPRSNLHIETKCPPLLDVRNAGIEAALGTDSLASNASLDVLAEARALGDRFSSVPARELLRMATWNGARALGRPELGRIRRGARPGIVGVDGDRIDDPASFLLRSLRLPRRWIEARR
jgi:cytosine/adenosine deaminase-related metal-dependent hydrolase